MMKQFDLFDWIKARNTPATVYRFPLARRADMVRAIASELLSRDERSGRQHWNTHVQQLRRQLRASGHTRPDIDSEIRNYARAVRIECLSSRPLREASR